MVISFLVRNIRLVAAGVDIGGGFAGEGDAAGDVGAAVFFVHEGDWEGGEVHVSFDDLLAGGRLRRVR